MGQGREDDGSSSVEGTPLTQSQSHITGTTHTLPLDKLSPRDFERLCLWLVEREGWERAELLDAAGSEGGRSLTAWRQGTLWVFRCKQAQHFDPGDALAVIDSVLALPQGERPAGLIFLVTCEVSADIRRQARDRCAGRIECYFSTDLDQRVQRHPDIVKEFFNPSSPSTPIIMTGEQLLHSAGAITWPFNGLNRPLGELLAEGAVQSRDLGWAISNAPDPTVRWAAAVRLKALPLQDVSMSVEEARQVTWPFRHLNRPMGELLTENVITLQDLVYAITNAHDPRVRAAAAVLGVEVAHRTRPSDDTLIGKAVEESPPAVATLMDTHAAAGSLDGETLRVIEGSTFLHDQEEQSRSQGWNLTLVLLVLVAVAAFAITMPGVSMGSAAIALVIAVVLLLGSVGGLHAGQRSFAQGRKGEERLVLFLEGRLDGQWALFRNVVLPDAEGDIDGVLIGSKGIYALEVKAYTGYNRNVGDRWQRRFRGHWRTLDRNPTRQARRNALRLHTYLKQHGVKVWVEPRVVWAGSGKLWLERPTVPVWQLTEPAYLLEDIERGRKLHRDMIKRTIAALEDV